MYTLVEVFNSPKRRVDNEVSRLADSAAALHMHLQVIGDITSQLRRARLTSYLQLIGGLVSIVCAPAGLLVLGLPIDVVATTAVIGSIGMIIIAYVKTKSLEHLAEKLATPEEFDKTFKKLYARRLAEHDEDTIALWTRLSEILRNAVTCKEIQQIGQINKSEIRELEKIIEKDIPELRRSVGPLYNR